MEPKVKDTRFAECLPEDFSMDLGQSKSSICEELKPLFDQNIEAAIDYFDPGEGLRSNGTYTWSKGTGYSKIGVYNYYNEDECFEDPEYYNTSKGQACFFQDPDTSCYEHLFLEAQILSGPEEGGTYALGESVRVYTKLKNCLGES